MKWKQRLLLTVLSALGLCGLLTISLSVPSEYHGDEHYRRLVVRQPTRHRHHKHGVTSKWTATNQTLLGSDKAEELLNGSIEALSLQNIRFLKIGRKQAGKKTRRKDNEIICSEMKHAQVSYFKRDGGYPDLVRLLKKEDPLLKSHQTHLSIGKIHQINTYDNLTTVERFYLNITEQEMYGEDEFLLDLVLQDMSTFPIVHVEEKTGGTQLKLLLTFDDGSQAIMKPMRFGRRKETNPNHFYFVDFERHVSEIAAFHIDRILKFRRTPPVVGRMLNITSEIYAVADDELLKTFFISPANNLCFHGQCSYYCDTSHAICGRPDNLEGSLSMLLPPKTLSGRRTWKNPWRRSYHKRRKAEWEDNDDFCDSVRMKPVYKNKQRLADVVDMSILDFFIGNMDRHHYETFTLFGNDSFIIHLDHGRGFGQSNHDEVSILAPLYQCCFIRYSTFQRLLELHYSSHNLSDVVRCSLHNDLLDPVLLEKHLLALDRRLVTILEALRNCLTRKPVSSIIYHDDKM